GPGPRRRGQPWTIRGLAAAASRCVPGRTLRPPRLSGQSRPDRRRRSRRPARREARATARLLPFLPSAGAPGKRAPGARAGVSPESAMNRATLSFATLMLMSPFVAAQDVNVAFKKFVLDNGLQVVIHEDHSDPVVAVYLDYHVGSGREEVGRSGFAHL